MNKDLKEMAIVTFSVLNMDDRNYIVITILLFVQLLTYSALKTNSKFE